MGNIKTFRFKRNKNFSINPPSRILHISNLVTNICDKYKIYNIFIKYGIVLKVKEIFKPPRKF